MLQTIYFFLLVTKKNSILYLAGNNIICNIYFILKQSNADLCWFKQDMKKATFSLVVEGFDRSRNGSVKIQGISACNYVWIYKNAHVLFLKSISTFFTLCNYKPFTLLSDSGISFYKQIDKWKVEIKYQGLLEYTKWIQQILYFSRRNSTIQ